MSVAIATYFANFLNFEFIMEKDVHTVLYIATIHTKIHLQV